MCRAERLGGRRASGLRKASPMWFQAALGIGHTLIYAWTGPLADGAGLGDPEFDLTDGDPGLALRSSGTALGADWRSGHGPHSHGSLDGSSSRRRTVLAIGRPRGEPENLQFGICALVDSRRSPARRATRSISLARRCGSARRLGTSCPSSSASIRSARPICWPAVRRRP